MSETIGERLKHAWSIFRGDKGDSYSVPVNQDLGISHMARPDRPRLSYNTERSVVSSVYNRLGIDVAAVEVRHARLDENGNFKGVETSGLNDCLTLDANLDQTGRSLLQDIAMTLFDEGVVAIVPVETSSSPVNSNAYDVKSLRVGKVLQWFPEHVVVDLYNEKSGRRQEVTLPKRMVAIVENPLYSVMNEPNSTLQRLLRKLALLDAVDDQSGSGKLDIIIQLPYVIKSKAREEQAEQRRKSIEAQLRGSQYGIAYTDGTERITQLNRPAENNLLNQVTYLTNMLYGQLGLTEEVFNGTAEEAVMLNYHNRTIEPVLAAITDEMNRKFLTKTARRQGQRVTFWRDPFKLVTLKQIAEVADRFTRNEILSSNEVRSQIGFKPVDDPKANELRNKNIPEPEPTEGNHQNGT